MSLRARLVLGGGLVAVVLVAAALVVIRSTRADLVQRVDDQLRATAPTAAMAAGFMDGPGTGRPLGPPGRGGWPQARGEGIGRSLTSAWVAVRADGRISTLLVLTDDTGEEVAPDLDDARLRRLEPGRLATVPGADGRHLRVLATDGPDGAVVLLGTPLDDVDSSVRRLVAVEVMATGAVLALLVLVALWVLRLGLRPIRRMTETASAIADGDLSRRVPEADPRTEAGELGIALNAMLAHIEGAMAASAASEDRLRRFVADASHELRTPITTIRGYAELHRRGGLEDPDARAQAMARTEQEAVRMGRLVEDLLLLARLDQGRPLDAEPVDLGALAADARHDAAVTHPDHPIALEVTGGCTVVGDEHRLRQVVGNLLANAVTHTPAGTAVTLRVAPVAGDERWVAVEVADEGPGMPAELAARAFERFARGDVARSRAAGSTGLGLSIVQAIVGAHGGAVALDAVEGGGTTVRVTLPRDGAPGGSRAPAGSS